MGRFYFNIRDGDDYTEDSEGTDLADLEAAHREALLAAREMLSEMVLRGHIVNGQMFEITDASGTVVDVVPFKSAMRLE